MHVGVGVEVELEVVVDVNKDTLPAFVRRNPNAKSIHHIPGQGLPMPPTLPPPLMSLRMTQLCMTAAFAQCLRSMPWTWKQQQ
jgi:hypothetical protein